MLVSAPAKGLKPVKSGGKAQHDAAATAAEWQRNGVAPQSDGGFRPSRFAPACGLAAAPALPCMCLVRVLCGTAGSSSAGGLPAHARRANTDENEKGGLKGFQDILLMRQLPENEH